MKLIYCATPKRIFHKSNEIINKVLSTGNAPFFPFFSFPINIFEDGPIGREKTINFCLKSIEICDELWFFGLSEGTILELNHAKNIGKKIRFIDLFDNEWELNKKQIEELKSVIVK